MEWSLPCQGRSQAGSLPVQVAWKKVPYVNRYLQEFSTVVTRKDKRQTSRKLVIQLKTGRPCLDCQVVYPHYMMDFDHVRGEKLGNIELIAREGNIPKLLDEIAKCDLVCSNCHRHRTYMRSAGKPRVDKVQ